MMMMMMMCTPIYDAGVFSSFGYNLIGGGNELATYNQPGDQPGVTNPMLAPLADNGGTTQTHALLPGSPAIDAGLAMVDNVAPRGTASQSSEFEFASFPADNAIDGDLTNFTHTDVADNMARWQVDLDDTYSISEIVLHNRNDVGTELRLRDITVEVLNSAGIAVFTSALLNPENVLSGPETLTIDLVSLTGNSVVGNMVRDSRTADPDNSGGGSGEADQNVLSLGEVVISGTLAYDQRGASFARITGGTIDMGAFESQSSVLGRHIFYENSVFDDPDGTGSETGAGANANDDGAIAPDKQALLPGRTATFANYTSYARGINGIRVDIAALPTTDLTPADFQFMVGNDDNPSGWTPLTVDPAISVRRGAGVGGSDRVTIIFPDNAVQKQWLEVTVKATANNGLTTPDVHYWGNAIGDSGNSTTDTIVNATDQINARNNPHSSFRDPALIDDVYDYNRDARVNATDEIVARNNSTSFRSDLNLISPIRSFSVAAALPMPSEKLLAASTDLRSSRRNRIASPIGTAFHAEAALGSYKGDTRAQRPIPVSDLLTDEEPDPTVVDELMEDVELLESLPQLFVF